MIPGGAAPATGLFHTAAHVGRDGKMAAMFSPPFLPSMSDLLQLELVDTDLYRGINEYPDDGRHTLFGGQVAAQALMAAGSTVPEGRHPHSMHGYFLRPGRRSHPVIFSVERDRDGRSFSARRVRALQGGAVIFDLTASFHVDEVGGEFVAPMPDDLAPPDECRQEHYNAQFPERRRPHGAAGARGRARARRQRPVVGEGARVAGRRPLGPRVRARVPVRHRLGVPSARRSTCSTVGASLDHAMWFRAPIRADEWVLSEMLPMHAGGARGLYRGSMFQRESGTLGVSFTQESLLRPVVAG